MIYLLDSNICIYCINKRYPRLIERVGQQPASTLAISAITKAEMYAGSSRRGAPTRYRREQDEFFERFPSLPFDDAAADRYGTIYAHLASAGQPIGVADTQIAAIALVHNLTLVTHNIRHFERVPNLAIEDWARD